MRLRTTITFVALLAIALGILLGGCGKELTPEEKQADSTLVLAKAQLDNGKYREGRQLLHSALAFDLKLNRAQQLAEEYSLLGRISSLSADFDSAIGHYTRAIEQYKSLADRANARALLLEVASLHRQMGEDRVAYAMYTEALGLSHVFNDVTGMREIQFAMLPVSRALENTEGQAQTINDLLKVYMESGNLGMQARAHYESALSFLERREYQQVTEPLLRALTFADQAKESLFVIKILSTLATAYDRAGNTQQSFETFTEALTRSDRTSGAQDIRLEMLIRVGNVYMRNAQFADAGRFYRAALSAAIVSKNKLAEGYLFVQLGHCALGDGKTDDAIKSIQNAVELFTPVGYGSGIAFANLGMGMAHQRAGRSNDALTYFKSAVEQKERCAAQPSGIYAESEQITLHRLSYYDPLIELLFQVGRSDEAFWYAERKTEHGLFEELNALNAHTRSNETNTLLDRLHHARALRIGAERQLANVLMRGPDDRMLREEIVARRKSAESAFDVTATAILSANPRLEPAVRFDGTTIAEVQRLLPQGAVLLRSVPTGRSLYTFAVTNSRVTMQLAAIDRERMRSLVTDYTSTFRQLVALSDSPAVQRKPLEQHMQDLSTQMYAAMVRPVESALSGATNVLVVTDEELTMAPVHALRKGSGTPYCIEQFPVSYLPSLTILKFKTPPSIPVRDIVGMGHPGTTAWDVEYELRDIRAFYKDTRLYFGQQASLATLQREHGDLLHLALDLRFTSYSPGNAHVLMSDVKTRGTTRDILLGDMLTTPVFPTVIVSHLRADSINVDGLLPALFLVNGSSSCMMNAHPASRKARKFFGEMIYTTLLGGKSADVAYRQALVEMIRNKDYATPYMWASFALWGKQ